MKKLTSVLFFVLLSSLGFSQYRQIDSLLSLLKTTKEDTNFVKTLNNLGRIEAQIGKYDSAVVCFNKALKLSIKMAFKRGESVSNNSLGIVYYLQGDYPNALQYYFATLKVNREIGNKQGMASTYNNIGLINYIQNNYEEAQKYFLASLNIKKELGDKNGMISSYNNIGMIYSHQKKYDIALKTYNELLTTSTEIGNVGGIAASYANIGLIYQNQNKHKEAEESYFKALKLVEQIGDEHQLAMLYNSIGSIKLYKNQAIDAKKWRKKALTIGLAIKSKEVIEAAYIGISQADSALGDYKSAFDNYKRYIVYRDSLINNENTKKITQMQMQYKFDQKEVADSIAHMKESEIQQAQIAKQKSEIQARRNEQYALFGGLALVLVFAVFMFNRFKVTQRQKATIEKQKEITEHQKLIVEEKNKEIHDSITYAKRIQDAILPSRYTLTENLKNGFVLFQPKDIVSGDFYWLERVGNATYFAAADCTGHGVPGAMVSVVCANALSKALLEENISATGKLLDRTRELVIERFENSDEDVKDGMDISLCKLEGNQLQWSGANNPLWLIRKGASEVEEIKADKQPIGKTDNPTPFTAHTISLNQGDSIYIFTDGYADQFGGENGKKFMYKPLKELLLGIQNDTLDNQKERLKQTFATWKGELEQVDDVCVIGVRV